MASWLGDQFVKKKHFKEEGGEASFYSLSVKRDLVIFVKNDSFAAWQLRQ